MAKVVSLEAYKRKRNKVVVVKQKKGQVVIIMQPTRERYYNDAS